MIWLRRFMAIALLAGMIGAAYYACSESFSQNWRAMVIEQLEKRHIYIDLERLTINPFSGVVARGIRVYHDENHDILLGEISRLNLDLDYGRMLRKELFIEGIDLQDADVRFPIDYEDPQSEIILIKDAHANVVLMGDRVEVRRASSTLYGLRVEFSASLLKPGRKDKEENKEEKEKRKKKRLEAIRARRNLIVQVAQALQHFESAKAPKLEVEVTGDLEEPEAINANMRLMANGLRHRNYVCEELLATATYINETLDISRIHVRDHLGELESSASWQLGSPYVNIHVQSTADLPGFLAALLQNELFREVVFYETPDVVADGRLLIGKAAPKDAFLPFEGTAWIRAGRFASRGEVLEGLTMNLGLSPDGCYIRDGLLNHKSGTTTFQAMWRQEQGLRYRAVIQMDPRVIIPFLKSTKMQETLQRIQLTTQSHFFLEIEGQGNEANLSTSHSKGHFDMRNVIYRGVPLDHFTGELDIVNRVHTFRNLYLQRKEGEARVASISHDLDANRVSVNQLAGTLHIAEVMSCINPKIAERIERYRFQKAPTLEMDGDIFYRSPETDLVVKFNSPGGTAVYPFKDRDYLINNPAGSLVFKNNELAFQISGSHNGGAMSCVGRTTLKSGESNFQFDLNAASLPQEVFRKQATFQKVVLKVNSRNQKLTYDLKANLFGGTFTAKGSADESRTPMHYQGEIMINAVSFREFAKVYSPSNDTEGDLTGHFKFNGLMGDLRSLRGEGALTILNSNLYAVPILGPLTPLIAAVLPRPIKGYNEAREADCTFTVANGFVNSKDIEAATAVFRLVAKGSVDFLENRLKFEAQARFRGLPGIVFFPVSEILEYVAEGSVNDPLWRPRYFSNSQERQDFRRPDELPISAQDGSTMSNQVSNEDAEPVKPVVRPARPAGGRDPASTVGVRPATTPRRSSRQKDPNITDPEKQPPPAKEANPFNKPGSPIRIGR